MEDKKLKSFAISLLRRGTFKWKPRAEAKKRYKVQDGEFSTGRPKYKYRCAICEELFMSKDVKMDHIETVIPLSGWVSFDSFITRMYCGEENYQCLCTECHDTKTAEERAERVRLRKEKKELDK